MSQFKTGDQIRNPELREEHLPKPGAQWTKIVPFASTFNSYEQLGGIEGATFAGNQLAKNLSTCPLTDLRATLFFEYRRYNHFGYDPDASAMEHLHALVEEIRLRIQGGEHLRETAT